MASTTNAHKSCIIPFPEKPCTICKIKYDSYCIHITKKKKSLQILRHWHLIGSTHKVYVLKTWLIASWAKDKLQNTMMLMFYVIEKKYVLGTCC